MNTILCLTKQELLFKNIFGQFFENFDHSDVVEFTFLLLLESESKMKKCENLQLEIRTASYMYIFFEKNEATIQVAPHIVSASKK